MSNYQALFDRLMCEVDRVNRQAAVRPEDAPEVSGTAYDDRIHVSMRAGKVTAIAIQPLAMRLSNAELGEHIMTAVNAAVDANLVSVLSDGQGIDLPQLNHALHEIQVESVVLMDQCTDQMMDVLLRARGL